MDPAVLDEQVKSIVRAQAAALARSEPVKAEARKREKPKLRERLSKRGDDPPPLPTPKTIGERVEWLMACGFSVEDVSIVLNEKPEAIRKKYAEEIRGGQARTTAKIACGPNGLIPQALSGNMTSMIFYLKTRAGWREYNRESDQPNEGAYADEQYRTKVIDTIILRLRSPDATPRTIEG